MLYLVCQKSIEFLVDSNFTDVFVLAYVVSTVQDECVIKCDI